MCHSLYCITGFSMNHLKLTFFVTQRQSNIGNFKSHLSLNCLCWHRWSLPLFLALSTWPITMWKPSKHLLKEWAKLSDTVWDADILACYTFYTEKYFNKIDGSFLKASGAEESMGALESGRQVRLSPLGLTTGDLGQVTYLFSCWALLFVKWDRR